MGAPFRDGVRWYELQHRRLVRPIRDLDGARLAGGAPDPVARLRAAEHAVSRGELTLARRHAQAAGRAAGRAGLRVRAEAESLLGDVAYEQGRPDAALRHYREAASIFETLLNGPAVGRLLAAIGRLLLMRGEQAAAIDSLRAAASRAPSDLAVQTGLGQALWYSGRLKAALAVLDGVLSQDGDTPEALRIRGEILADMGDVEASLRDLDRIDRRTKPSARAARALSLAAVSRRDAALEELDGILTLAADNGPVLFRMAQVEQLGGDTGSAAELATRAIAATDPPLPVHQRTQAKILLSRLRGLTAP